ncbi:MAG: hypothetical protein MRY74_05140 [Neomegalonema sp.]|nr:hypothetical protein [Neomegalonema sp.]
MGAFGMIGRIGAAAGLWVALGGGLIASQTPAVSSDAPLTDAPLTPGLYCPTSVKAELPSERTPCVKLAILRSELLATDASAAGIDVAGSSRRFALSPLGDGLALMQVRSEQLALKKGYFLLSVVMIRPNSFVYLDVDLRALTAADRAAAATSGVVLARADKSEIEIIKSGAPAAIRAWLKGVVERRVQTERGGAKSADKLASGLNFYVLTAATAAPDTRTTQAEVKAAVAAAVAAVASVGD